MPWHRVTISVSRVAAGDGLRLMDEMEAVFAAAGFPREAAVFGDTNASPESELYFNPAASVLCARLLEKWGGTPCEDPGSPVALLIGHQAAYGEQNAKPRRPGAKDYSL